MTNLVFSPGRMIAAGIADGVRLWDAGTGDPIDNPMTGHRDSVTSLALSPNGSQIISGNGDETVRRWAATTGQATGYPIIITGQ